MKTQFLLLAIVTSVVLLGCEKPPPPEPSLMECEKNNWSYIYFENRSGSNKTYDVFWDGTRIIKGLAPGEKSVRFTFSASQHEYSFKVANTNNLACSIAYPSLAKCTTVTFYCVY